MEVSIIIPVYNSEETVNRAVNSALNQDFPEKDFEIIVINDGSTDNTLKILKKYSKKIRLISQKNQGTIKTANKGFELAKGKHVIKLDADDYFCQTALKEMTKAFNNNPVVDFVYCDYYEKTERGKIKVISTGKNLFNTLASGIMIKREKFKKQGFYNEKIKFAEYDLLLKILNKWTGYHISKPLFCYIRSKKSITGNKKWVINALKELKKKYPEKTEIINKIREY